jgi:hypothetical protein
VGMMKQMKGMRDMVDAAPGMVAQAPQLGAQVQQLVAARLATVDPSNPRSTAGFRGALGNPSLFRPNAQGRQMSFL